MNIRSSLLIFFGCTIGGGIIALLFSALTQHTKYETITFITVVSSDEDSSVSEKESAANFFTETLIGWTRDPSFQEEVMAMSKIPGNFSLQRQERRNLVLITSSERENHSDIILKEALKTLQERIYEHNIISKTNYDLIIAPATNNQKNPTLLFGFLGGLVLGMFFGGSIVYIRKNQKALIMGVKKLIC
jgi:hypothetical protein